MIGDARFERAIALIDAANASDPTTVTIGEVAARKKLVHSEMLTRWVRELTSEPSEALLLAARGQHIRRWEHPRSSFPEGRGGYLRWRTGLYVFHAETTAALLSKAGYDDATIARVSAIIRKKGLGRDTEVQASKTASAWSSWKRNLPNSRAALTARRCSEILRKTWRKMSPGRAPARTGADFRAGGARAYWRRPGAGYS